MDNLEPITTENLARLKKTYRDIGDFYLSRSTGNGSISERYRKLSGIYTKASGNLDRLFENGTFRGDNSYNVVSDDLEKAYYNILNSDHDSTLLPLIREVHDIIDKAPVKN